MLCAYISLSFIMLKIENDICAFNSMGKFEKFLFLYEQL